MSDPWLERKVKGIVKRQQDHRSPFQRDRARILHSAAFRRLQSKTQVMGSGQSDFYRTRLTHSLEVAQIGSGISSQLRSKYPEECQALFPTDDNLIESLCLAHDIGHPPFGHGGEVALHFMMRKHGGFEGNGQTLRIVSKLEPFSEFDGMNLTRRTLLGLIKYPQTLENLTKNEESAIPSSYRQLKSSDWYPPKGIYSDDLDTFNWVLAPLSASDKQRFQQIKTKEHKHHKTCFKSLDCSIMEIADDIAYGIHDMEDAIVTGVVSSTDFETHVIDNLLKIDDEWLREFCTTLTSNLFNDKHHKQKEAIGGLVNYLITSIILKDTNLDIGIDIDKDTEKNNETKGLTKFTEPLLKYNAQLPKNAAAILQIFKNFVLDFVIKQATIQQIEYRGQQIIMEIFEALNSDPMRLLPKNTAKRWQYAKTNNLNHHRVIADYVAGMTDDYATKLYQTLFLPHNNPTLSKSNY